MVSSTLRPHFTPGKDPVPIVQEAGWAPGPVWTGGNSRPHRDSIPDRPARGQSLYRLSYLPGPHSYDYYASKFIKKSFIFLIYSGTNIFKFGDIMCRKFIHNVWSERIRSKTMKWAEHVARVGEKKSIQEFGDETCRKERT